MSEGICKDCDRPFIYDGAPEDVQYCMCWAKKAPMSEKPELLPWTMTKGDFGHWNAHLNGKLVYSAKKEWVQKYVDDRNEAFEMGRRSSAPQAQGAGKVEVVPHVHGGPDSLCDLSCYPNDLEDARTLAAYWLMADEERRRQMWSCDMKKICETLLKFTDQAALTSSQERDMTPEEALAEARRRWGPNGWVEAVVRGNIRKTFEVGAYEWDKSVPPARVWTKHWTAGNFRTAFASCDKAQEPIGEAKDMMLKNIVSKYLAVENPVARQIVMELQSFINKVKE